MAGGRRGPGFARAALVSAATALLLAACSSGGGGSAGPSTSAGGSVAPAATQPDDGVTPPEARLHAADWPLPGRDHRNSRAVPDSPITAASVARLREVWRAPLLPEGPIGNAATTPLIIGDRILIQDLSSNVRAFERDTGALVWERKVDRLITGPSGVAVGWGRAYAAKGMKEVMALDLASGEELWSVPLVDTPTGGIDIQPQVAAGLVLVSTVPVSYDGVYTGGDRGVLTALDAATGTVVWRFDTTVDDLWGNPAVNSGGGAWFPPAVDPASGLVYWGTGNPAPFPGTPEFPNGSSRPGANLYTDSVVALDLRTGELRWYHQVTPHDIFDRDQTHAMLVPTDGGTLLVSAGKSGVVVGLDPATGDVRWTTEVGIHRNDDLTELPGPTEVWPGTYGGVLTPPSSADGVVYVATINSPTTLEPGKTAYIGSNLGLHDGEVVAIDARDGSVRWHTDVPGDPMGGTTVVGDLVLTATFDGHLFALARTDGRVVWDLQVDGNINGWPAVADDLVVWPVGQAQPPALVAFRLGD